MSIATAFQGLKNFLKMNFVTRITGVMVKGSLGQKVTVILGGLFILFGIYRAFHWILLATAGYILIYLAFKDYERITESSNS